MNITTPSGKNGKKMGGYAVEKHVHVQYAE